MKSISLFFVILFLGSIMLVSCAEQTEVKSALIKENQEMGNQTNATYLEKETESSTIAKHKILITPFEYSSTNSKYPNPEIYKTIFFSSFYNLFSVLPTIDLPDKSVLLSMNLSEDTISNLADQYKSDYIVFGDYGLKGDKSKPEAIVNLKIWNKLSGSISTNSIITPTDADLFDNIDLMSSKMVKTMLNEEMKIAYINFNNLDTGKEKLGIFINHRLVAEPISNDFKLNMKILSGKDYNVSIRRFSDGKLLKDDVANLKPGETKSYSATNIRVNLIKNATFDKSNELKYLEFKSNDDYYNKLLSIEHAGKWHFTVRDMAKATVNIEENVCHIKINKTGDYWYSVTLRPSPIKLKYGKKYRLSFDARAANIFKLYYKIQKLWTWENYVSLGYNLDSSLLKINNEMKNYSFIFKMNYSSDEKSILIFGFGDVDDVWISNVWLEEID